MRITLNGKELEIAQGLTVSGLLDGQAIKRDGMAVELNLEIVTRDRHDSTVLKQGDRVEIIRMIGGG